MDSRRCGAFDRFLKIRRPQTPYMSTAEHRIDHPGRRTAEPTARAAEPEMDVNPFFFTQPNPTHHMCWKMRPNPWMDPATHVDLWADQYDDADDDAGDGEVHSDATLRLCSVPVSRRRVARPAREHHRRQTYARTQRNRRCKQTFFNVFLIFRTFSLFFEKNVGKVRSGKQINKKHFHNNSNETDL